jgi:hypothetical protein
MMLFKVIYSAKREEEEAQRCRRSESKERIKIGRGKRKKDNLNTTNRAPVQLRQATATRPPHCQHIFQQHISPVGSSTSPEPISRIGHVVMSGEMMPKPMRSWSGLGTDEQ